MLDEHGYARGEVKAWRTAEAGLENAPPCGKSRYDNFGYRKQDTPGVLPLCSPEGTKQGLSSLANPRL